MINRRIVFLIFFFTLIFSRVFVFTAQAQTGASLSLIPETQTMGVTQLFATDVVVNAGPNEIGGVGAVLKYDPQYVIVDHIETGTEFDDYPLAAFDNDEGKAAISGIVGSPDKLLTGTVTVGKIIWRAVALGNTTVSFDFTEGSTTDSNVAVTTGSGDALSAVSPLTLAIVQEPQPGAISEEDNTTAFEDTDTTSTEETVTPTSAPFIAQVGSFFNRLLGREETGPQIDPYQPLAQMPPKTTFSELPETETPASSSPFASPLPIIIGIIIIALAVVVLIAKSIRNKTRASEPAHVVMDPIATPMTPPTVTPDSSTQVPPVPQNPEKPVI